MEDNARDKLMLIFLRLMNSIWLFGCFIDLTPQRIFFFSNTWKFWYRLVLKNKFKENVASQIKKIMFRQHLNRQISWMLWLRHCFALCFLVCYRYRLVFFIMVIHGVGILMPWNMLINAKTVSTCSFLICLMSNW